MRFGRNIVMLSSIVTLVILVLRNASFTMEDFSLTRAVVVKLPVWGNIVNIAHKKQRLLPCPSGFPPCGYF